MPVGRLSVQLSRLATLARDDVHFRGIKTVLLTLARGQVFVSDLFPSVLPFVLCASKCAFDTGFGARDRVRVSRLDDAEQVLAYIPASHCAPCTIARA